MLFGNHERFFQEYEFSRNKLRIYGTFTVPDNSLESFCRGRIPSGYGTQGTSLPWDSSNT